MYSCCYRVIHASFEHVQKGSFWDIVMLYPSMYLFAIMEHPSLTRSCSTFAKMFLAGCLRVGQFCRGCCSWSMHAMRLFLPCLASMPCLLAGCMLSLSCNALWWVHRARKRAFIILLCHVQFSAKSESVNETCYVNMVAIVFSDHFWLMVSKGLLLYALCSFMPCLALSWYVPVAWCYRALNIASWC